MSRTKRPRSSPLRGRRLRATRFVEPVCKADHATEPCDECGTVPDLSAEEIAEAVVRGSSDPADGPVLSPTVEEMLAELALGWVVTLATMGPLQWRLELVSPHQQGDPWAKDYKRRTFVYRGTLASVVSRAHAGEPGDK